MDIVLNGFGLSENQSDEAPADNANADKDKVGQPRDAGRQPGMRGRGGPKQFFNSNRAGRPMDRVSGSDKTGVKPMTKKDGAGKGNWGTETDELTGETEPTQTTDEETKTKTAESGAEDAGEKTAEEAGGEEQAGEKEEEKPRMTLDEWKAQHKPEQPHFNVRKAGEGSDQKAYQNFVPIPKDAVSDQAAHDDEEDTGAKVVSLLSSPIAISIQSI